MEGSSSAGAVAISHPTHPTGFRGEVEEEGDGEREILEGRAPPLLRDEEGAGWASSFLARLEGVVAAGIGVGFLAGEEEFRVVRVVVDGGGAGGGSSTFFFRGEDLLRGLDEAAAVDLVLEGPACLDALSLVVLGELVEGCWSC